MAIVQISRVTQRKGLEEDLPQPLASAELGWAIDQRRLFIGNGTLAEGAPVVGNTEILTEFSDILAVASAYTYQGDAAGYTVQTGASAGSPVKQSLQSRLDSMAIVTDFGATGDGITDDTDAINRALYQLYCRQNNPQIRRSLFFPAGVYLVSDTILIPPYARLYGEGANSSIIRFSAVRWFANTAYAADVLVKYTDGDTDDLYRSKQLVPATGILITDTDYWEVVSSLPEYVARTTDSLQQTGANIGTNGATAPRNIELQDLCFETTESANDSSLGNSHSLMLIEQAEQVSVISTNFLGPLTTAELTNAVEEMAGITLAGTAARVCTNVTVDQCKIAGMTYGVLCDDATKGVVISNGWFDTLYQGIGLGIGTVVNGGATGFRIAHNIFDNIYAEGVILRDCSLNGTLYNTFYDVGNAFFGTPISSGLSTAVITINADNNISVGDMFQRNDSEAEISPRVDIWNSTTSTVPVSMVTTSAIQSQMGSYVRTSGQQATLADGATNVTLFTVDTAIPTSQGGFQGIRMDYTIHRDDAGVPGTRRGVFTATGSGFYPTVWSDDYDENLDVQVTFSTQFVGGFEFAVKYTVGFTSWGPATLYYSITHLP